MTSAETLSQYGLHNAEIIVQVAEETGVPLWIAAAYIEKESGGRNVYGNDYGGVYSTSDPLRPNPNNVTEANFKAFERRVLDGATSNGVGPCQITYPGFIKQAKEQGIRLWVPIDNIRFGFNLIKGYLRGKTDDQTIREAGTLYNAGNLLNGVNAYGDDLLRKAKIWRTRLEGQTMTTNYGKSDLGWTITSDIPTAKRVAPHIIGNGNGREIWFRNNATADLLVATMWMIHTGCGGRRKDYPVVYFHGFRPRSADFGSPNSDHKAGVAFDVNWHEHPWERTIGTAKYDAHMSSSAYKTSHALFDAVEKFMTPPNSRPIVRWCGRPWKTPAGWTAYPRGYRDCMHWVIEAPDWKRINAARDWLHTWFVPPRTVEDIKAWQRRVGAKADGLWNAGSIKAMRAYQKKMGVRQTGLPGDKATWAAYKNSLNKPAPKPAPKPDPKPEPKPEVPDMPEFRIAGETAYSTALEAVDAKLPAGSGLILAVRDSTDYSAAVVLAARNLNAVPLPLTSGGLIPSEYDELLVKGQFEWFRVMGGSAAVPNATVAEVKERLGL